MLHEIAQQTRGDGELGEGEARGGDVVHGRADALDLARMGGDPLLDRGRPGDAVADHLGSEPPFRVGDRVERSIERELIEIIGELDAARRMRNAVELEIRPGGKECRADFVDRLSGAVREGTRGIRSATHRRNGRFSRKFRYARQSRQDARKGEYGIIAGRRGIVLIKSNRDR